MKKQILYGMLGFLSLLGFCRRVYGSAGIPGLLRLCGGLPVLLFLKSDEMLEAQLGPVRLPGVCGRDADDGGRCAGDP